MFMIISMICFLYSKSSVSNFKNIDDIINKTNTSVKRKNKFTDSNNRRVKKNLQDSSIKCKLIDRFLFDSPDFPQIVDPHINGVSEICEICEDQFPKTNMNYKSCAVKPCTNCKAILHLKCFAFHYSDKLETNPGKCTLCDTYYEKCYCDIVNDIIQNHRRTNDIVKCEYCIAKYEV
jgi:hypothetical protein